MHRNLDVGLSNARIDRRLRHALAVDARLPDCTRLLRREGAEQIVHIQARDHRLLEPFGDEDVVHILDRHRLPALTIVIDHAIARYGVEPSGKRTLAVIGCAARVHGDQCLLH